MEVALLGPFEVRADGRRALVGGEKRCALLALLALRANRVVAREQLVEGLWGDDPPGTAAKAVQVYASQLRKVLPDGVLVTRPPGYVLEVEPDGVDLYRFISLVSAASEAEPARASFLLRSALALWRGPPLAEFGDERFAQVEASRLEELRLAALKDLIDADLALGRHRELVAELEKLVDEHPYRERLRGQLMLALYRSGRQAEALEAYRAARVELGALGLQPSPPLRNLEKQILTQDPALELSRPTLLANGGHGRTQLPGPLVSASPSPFVRRARELDLLRSLLRRAERGEGGFALVAAETGGGKTRLVRELAHDAANGGVLVLYGASDPSVGTPYQPLLEWFAFLHRVCNQDALQALLAPAAEPLGQVVPELVRSNGTPADNSDAPETRRYRLHTAVTNTLVRISRVQPLLLVFDDLDRADRETLYLVRHLARTAPEARILIVATAGDRGEENLPTLSEVLADLSSLDAVTWLTLTPLNEDVRSRARRPEQSRRAGVRVRHR